MSTSEKSKLPVIYLSHGGGPCFFMDWSPMGPADTWNKMADWLENLHRTFPLPKAIVVASAHWEESEFTIMSEEAPELLFDYSGFPPHTYELTYPAPGSPELAAKIQNLFKSAGITSRIETTRGFDHGVFIPFKLIYPKADIPIVQVSLKKGLDPTEHLAMGKALSSLREEGVLIVGSGMSYHNLRELFKGAPHIQEADIFDAWMTSISTLHPTERNEQLKNWARAPSARAAHPREEHLIPLMVVAGAAGEDLGGRVFNDNVMGAATSAFQFG